MPRPVLFDRPLTNAERQARWRAKQAKADGRRLLVDADRLSLTAIDPKAIPINLEHLRRWPKLLAAFLAARLDPAEYQALLDALSEQQPPPRVLGDSPT